MFENKARVIKIIVKTYIKILKQTNKILDFQTNFYFIKYRRIDFKNCFSKSF